MNTAQHKNYRYIWYLVTILALTIFFTYAMRIWYRSGRPDPEFLSFSANIVQIISIISLLGLQTQRGKDILRSLWGNFKLWRGTNSSIMLGFASLIAMSLVLVIFYVLLPYRAERLNSRGVAQIESGRYSLASDSLRYAVSLSPNNALYHYNLGNAYGRMDDYEKAMVEYRRALDLDTTLYEAYNNLGRLYLEIDDNPNDALRLLHRGKGLIEGEIADAALDKNLGWAYFQKGLYQTALLYLNEADKTLNQLSDGQRDRSSIDNIFLWAEVNRLRAMVNEQLGYHSGAKKIWCEVHSSIVILTPHCSGENQKNFQCIEAKIWLSETLEKKSDCDDRNHSAP